jgi:hypothetical protein
MKNLFAILILSLSFSASAYEPSDIWGKWQYDGFFFEEHRYPNPNPNLYLTFEFMDNSVMRLFWEYKDEAGRFCEKLARYVVKDSFFRQETYWLNPDNHFTCGQDPDMQNGKVTTNQFELVGTELHMIMSLNGKPFRYILKKLEAEKP